MKTLTRTLFCKKCLDNLRPKRGDWIAYMNNDELTLRQVEVPPPLKDRGLVPHFIALDNIQDGIATVHCACGVVGCGMSMGEISENDTAKVTSVEVVTIKLPEREWNALYDCRENFEF